MPEHLIRLRGAWDWADPAGTRRLDLPTTWPPGLAGPLVLSRRFRRPRIDPDRESLAIRLADVPGLIVARLNGDEIARPDSGASTLEVAPGPLPDGNLLTLEVDPAGVGEGPWGSIALVIRGS